MASQKAAADYYPAFDYLRIALACVVAFGHAGGPIWEQAGNFSVQVFFAMSGWLIGGILLKSTPDQLPRFYFNRAARIWIPYFVAIGLLMLASVLKEPITRKWLEIFFYDGTFTYNYFGPPQLAKFGNEMPLQATGNHFWSICAEEQFYLLAPFLITIPSKIGRSAWFWCFASAVAIFSPFWIFFSAISLGVLAAVLRANFGNWHTKNTATFCLALFGILSFLAIYLGFVPYRFGAPFSAISIVLVFAQTGIPTRFSLFVGSISYPMYLNHWIGTFIAHAIFKTFGMRNTIYSEIASVIFALIIASVLFLGVDRVVIARRDYFFTRTRGLALATSGFALLSAGFVGAFLIARY